MTYIDKYCFCEPTPELADSAHGRLHHKYTNHLGLFFGRSEYQ